MMKLRSMLPLMAKGRLAGPMHDRRASRGGATNKQRDLLDEHDAYHADGFEVEVLPPDIDPNAPDLDLLHGFPCAHPDHAGKCWTEADERAYQVAGGFDPFED